MNIISIKSRQDFVKIKNKADNTTKTDFFILLTKKTDERYINELEFIRSGYLISRKFNKKAVVRNKTKRIFKNIFQQLNKELAFEKHIDYILIPKTSILTAKFADIKEELKKYILSN